MGSGTSRGTKVAPAGLGEAKLAKKASSSVVSSKRDAFDALRIHARRRAPVDCHSAGHDSEISGDGDGDEDDDADADVELDAGYGEAVDAGRRRGKKNPVSKRAFMRSRTYGLCHFSSKDQDEEQEQEQEQEQQGASSTSSSSSSSSATSGLGGAQGAQGCPGTGHNKRGHDAFAPPHAFLTTGPIEEDAPLPQIQTTFGHSTPVATPVILYDGSEEELMDTIERDFS
ncbi:uncharacterized protein LOC133513639 [Syngnathoides biaculeatus]|uniref:uncharacterized protein LOC133513639 n=1 Tax=Syngnathoides biaculeatus TaxID=300417 RepID=UPI002ADD7F71|nr:uncharacterized protein LOC133513639 [Syngnathoides biaculeatus]